GEAGDAIADQARDQHIGSRRRLRHREELHEIGRGGPAFHVDDVALHLRHHRAHTAESEQAEQREVKAELEQDHSRRLREARMPSATATGITMSSETRPIAMARNTATISAIAAGLRAIGRASLTAVAMKRPAPAAPTPVTTADTIACEAHCV